MKGQGDRDSRSVVPGGSKWQEPFEAPHVSDGQFDGLICNGT